MALADGCLGNSMGGRDGRLFVTPLDTDMDVEVVVVVITELEEMEEDLEDMLDVRGGGTGLAVGLADRMQA